MPHPFRRAALGAALSLPLVLSACGGGGSSAQYSGSTLNGTVLMSATAPVTGGSNVCIYAIVNGQGNPLNTGTTPPSNTGTLLTNGCISSSATGGFSQDLSTFYGPVLIQITGGTYASDATGAAAGLTPLTSTNAALQAVAFIGGGGTVNVVVSPLTTVATAIALNLPGGLTAANYATAWAKVSSEFQLGTLAVNTRPSAGDAQDLALRGVEQYLALPPGSTDDANANNLLTWNTAALGNASTVGTVSYDYTQAYNAINHLSASFNFQ